MIVHKIALFFGLLLMAPLAGATTTDLVSATTPPNCIQDPGRCSLYGSKEICVGPVCVTVEVRAQGGGEHDGNATAKPGASGEVNVTFRGNKDVPRTSANVTIGFWTNVTGVQWTGDASGSLNMTSNPTDTQERSFAFQLAPTASGTIVFPFVLHAGNDTGGASVLLEIVTARSPAAGAPLVLGAIAVVGALLGRKRT